MFGGVESSAVDLWRSLQMPLTPQLPQVGAQIQVPVTVDPERWNQSEGRVVFQRAFEVTAQSGARRNHDWSSTFENRFEWMGWPVNWWPNFEVSNLDYSGCKSEQACYMT